MNMKLRNVGSNMTELDLTGGNTVLFSYETPVAASTPDGFVRTDKHHSPTTSRHINKWLEGREAKTVPQSELDDMVVML
jgi:hypothetical protein